MAQTNPRQTQYQQTHYFRGSVGFDETGSITTGILRGTLPAGAIITGTSVMVDTAFNAGVTQIFTLGTNSASWNNIVAAADVDETTIALTNGIKPTGTALGSLAADTDFYAKMTQSGTAATAGKLWYTIFFIPNNDEGSGSNT